MTDDPSNHRSCPSAAEFLQEPGLTDIRAVRLDPDLGHADYAGEYVIATEYTYLIKRTGQVMVVGETKRIFKIT